MLEGISPWERRAGLALVSEAYASWGSTAVRRAGEALYPAYQWLRRHASWHRCDAVYRRSGRLPTPLVSGLHLLVELEVASDQGAEPMRVGHRGDAEGVRSSRFAAVVGLDGEGPGARAGGPDDQGRAGERGI